MSESKVLTVDEWLELADKNVKENAASVCFTLDCQYCPFYMTQCEYILGKGEISYTQMTTKLYKEQKNIQKNIKLVESL